MSGATAPWLGRYYARGASPSLVCYVGSYTHPMGHVPGACGAGVSAYALDEATGALSPLCAPLALENPSFLALAPTRRTLYAALEKCEGDGALAALALDPATGAVARLLNETTSEGGAP